MKTVMILLSLVLADVASGGEVHVEAWRSFRASSVHGTLDGFFANIRHRARF
jgi:hypothetical protein